MFLNDGEFTYVKSDDRYILKFLTLSGSEYYSIDSFLLKTHLNISDFFYVDANWPCKITKHNIIFKNEESIIEVVDYLNGLLIMNSLLK